MPEQTTPTTQTTFDPRDLNWVRQGWCYAASGGLGWGVEIVDNVAHIYPLSPLGTPYAGLPFLVTCEEEGIFMLRGQGPNASPAGMISFPSLSAAVRHLCPLTEAQEADAKSFSGF